MKKREYLWEHKVDIAQDAVIELAMIHWKKKTGAIISRHTMLKIIIMEYAKELDRKGEPIERIIHPQIMENKIKDLI